MPCYRCYCCCCCHSCIVHPASRPITWLLCSIEAIIIADLTSITRRRALWLLRLTFGGALFRPLSRCLASFHSSSAPGGLLDGPVNSGLGHLAERNWQMTIFIALRGYLNVPVVTRVSPPLTGKTVQFRGTWRMDFHGGLRDKGESKLYVPKVEQVRAVIHVTLGELVFLVAFTAGGTFLVITSSVPNG